MPGLVLKKLEIKYFCVLSFTLWENVQTVAIGGELAHKCEDIKHTGYQKKITKLVFYPAVFDFKLSDWKSLTVQLHFI